MGKAIEQIARERGHKISAIIDLTNQDELASLTTENTDVVIEFTHPDSFQGNLLSVMQQGIPLVSGTTGWHDQATEISGIVNQHAGTFVHSSNFSIGVNLLFKLNQQLAILMNKHAQYDCFIQESHHRYKADAPSGTAVSLGKQVLDHLDRKTTLATEELRSRPPKADELSIGYVRSGEIIGQHKVSYTSAIDSIHIEHIAHNRTGFALGAVVAAEWITQNQAQGMIEFSDIL